MKDMEKMYQSALLVGRFQIIHSGHEDMISRALKLATRTMILIGSSNESGNEKNPFSYEEREKMLKKIFPSVEIAPLEDIGVGNCAAWGEYVLDSAYSSFNTYPDLFVSGSETRREEWFASEKGKNVTRLIIPKTIPICASEMREFLINNEKEKFLSFISPSLHSDYDFMRERILSVRGKTDTKSI